VELVVPGSAIRSTWLGGQYKLSSGMSMVTPFVTGAIALLLGSDEHAWSDTEMVDGDGSWTNDEVRKVLRGTAKDLGKEEGMDNTFLRTACSACISLQGSKNQPCRRKTSTSSSSRRQVIIQYHIWRRVHDYAVILYIS
jgi:subtilisin family serine protease